MEPTLKKSDLYIIDPMYFNLPNANYNYIWSACQHGLLRKWSVNCGGTADVQVTKAGEPVFVITLAKGERPSRQRHIRVPQQPDELLYVDVWGPCDTALLHD